MNKGIIKDYILIHKEKFYDHEFKIILSMGHNINFITIKILYSNSKKCDETLDQDNIYINLYDIEKLKSDIQFKIDLFKKQINYYIEKLNTILYIFNKYENQ